MGKLSSVNKILLVIAVILLLALGMVVYWQKVGFKESYWAVYFQSGDLYFGKLQRFPRLSLSEVWFFQKDPNNPQNSLNLAKLTDAIWGPEDKIYFTTDQVIWMTKLKEGTQVVEYFKNNALKSNQPSESPAPNP